MSNRTTYYNGAGGEVPSNTGWDGTAASVDSASIARGFVISDGVHGTPRISSETRGNSSAVAPAILV